MNRSMRPFLFTLVNFSAPILKHQKRPFFFLPGKSQSKINYNDTAVVNLPQSLLYDVVADVDQYRHFVPNCFESEVLERRSPSLMRAKLTVGIPKVISADYISTIYLTKPNRILTRSEENKFMRYLESEWRFEPVVTRGKKVDPNRTLVKFRVEFELYSAVAANLLSVVFDDFTRKTMEAFLHRAERMHRRSSLRARTHHHHQAGSPSPTSTTTTTTAEDDKDLPRKR